MGTQYPGYGHFLPYFELLDNWTPTYQTSIKVYLDAPKGYEKNQFPCQDPGTCEGKQTVFGRPAALGCHYKNVHAEKDIFPCDYPKCPRNQEPFSRRDHYRDHLRDFHKEDIVCAKGEKSSRYKARLTEPTVSTRNWRCSKCLMRNFVANGWDCVSCKGPCEEDRRRNRGRLAIGLNTLVGVSIKTTPIKTTPMETNLT